MKFIKLHNTVKSVVIGQEPRIDPVWIKAESVLWVACSEDYEHPVTIVKMEVAQIECDESPAEVVELLERALHE